MSSALPLPLTKTAVALISLAAATCCIGFAGTASAQALPSPSAVSDDLLRSSGPWIDKRSFDSLPADKPKPLARAAQSTPIYFKPATPGWVGALDAASYIIGGVTNGTSLSSNVGSSGKLYGPAPRLDNPAAPAD